MKHKLKSILYGCLAGSAVALSSTPSLAVSITLEGVEYNVDFFYGTYNDNQELLEEQPWWGSSTLAENAADQVGEGLGVVNMLSGTINGSSDLGAFFAHRIEEEQPLFFTRPDPPSDPELLVISQVYSYGSGRSSAALSSSLDEEKGYAFVTETVPEPLSIIGIFAVAGFLPLLRNYKIQ